MLLIKLKEDVEIELEDRRWQTIADKMKVEKPGSKQSAKLLKKRYADIKNSGWKLGASVEDGKPALSIAAAMARDGGFAAQGANEYDEDDSDIEAKLESGEECEGQADEDDKTGSESD